MNSAVDQVRSIRVDRAFLRGLFWILVVLYLASTSRFVRGIYDILLKRPELRTQVVIPNNDVWIGKDLFFQRDVLIRNRGNADAREVYVVVDAPGSDITRIDVRSQEPYTETHSIDLAKGSLYSFSLKRLAAGASFEVRLWAHQYNDAASPEFAVTASFDGGVAEDITEDTALGEIQSIGSTVHRAATALASRLIAYFPQQPKSNTWEVLQSGITEVLPFLLLLILGAWLLLRRAWAAAVTASVVGLTVFLFVDSWVSSALLIFPLVSAIPMLIFTRNKSERKILLGSIVVVGVGVLDPGCVRTMWLVHRAVPIPQCLPTEVPLGLLVSCVLLILYLVFTEH